jgi:shikimate O-hydroxycinnamoyltransferase
VFFKSWAATFRGEPDQERPRFESATLFPARSLFGYDPRNPIFETNIVAKRFVFSKSSIEALIAKYYKATNTEKLQRPSPIDVLSAFLWNQIVAATMVQWKTHTVHELVHYMNLRSIMCPPQSEYSFGNISWAAKTVPSVGEGCNLASQIRESINKVDSEYVKTL